MRCVRTRQVTMLFAYYVATGFMAVYDLAIDTIFLCFCEVRGRARASVRVMRVLMEHERTGLERERRRVSSVRHEPAAAQHRGPLQRGAQGVRASVRHLRAIPRADAFVSAAVARRCSLCSAQRLQAATTGE